MIDLSNIKNCRINQILFKKAYYNDGNTEVIIFFSTNEGISIFNFFLRLSATHAAKKSIIQINLG